MDVSIILVNYNTAQLTKNCIDSINEHTKEIEYEIIVVDNDSKDNSKEILSTISKVVWIESGSNLGFGKGNDLGLNYAKGKYVLYLNTDTLILNNAIKCFFEFAERYQKEKFGVIGAKLLNSKFKPGNSNGLKLSFFNVFIFPIYRKFMNFFGKNIQIEAEIPEDKRYVVVDYVLGADMFLNRELALKYRFDEKIFMYGEEGEMQLRIQKDGYRNVIISDKTPESPSIAHIHKGSSGANNQSLFLLRNRTFGTLYPIRKHNTRAYYFTFCLFYLLYAIIYRMPKHSIEYNRVMFSEIIKSFKY